MNDLEPILEKVAIAVLNKFAPEIAGEITLQELREFLKKIQIKGVLDE